MYKEDWDRWPEFNPRPPGDPQTSNQSQGAVANEDNPPLTSPSATTVDSSTPRDTVQTADVGVKGVESPKHDILSSGKANISKTFMSQGGGVGRGGAETQTDVEMLCQAIADRIVVVSEGNRGGVALRLPLTCVGRGSRVSGGDAEEGEWEDELGSGARRRSIGFGDNGGVGTVGHEVEDVAKVNCLVQSVHN